METTIDKLQIEIESSAKGGQRGLTQLKNTLKKLGELSAGLSKINTDGVEKLHSIASGIEALANAGSNAGLNKTVSALRRISNLDFSKLSNANFSGLAGIGKVAPNVSGFANQSIIPSEVVKALKNEMEGLYKNVKVNATKSGVAIQKGITGPIHRASSAINRIRGAFDGVFKSIKGRLVGMGQGIKQQLTKPFEFFTHGLGRFTSSLGRIALYRTVRKILSEIAKAIKEGVENLYQYSKVMGGAFAASLDSAASGFLYLKNSVGAAAASIMGALAPVINYIIGRIVALINILNQLFARITGAGTWTKAVKTQTEFAEAAGGAASAAKDMAAGFDELNVISDSSGGGGAGTPDYGSMFEEVALDDSFATWIDDIKAAIEAGDWAGAGAILGNKVNELIDSVDFAELGKKVGQSIQHAFEFLYTFLDTINFDNIGAGIATFLNNAIEQIDFELVGKTFAKKWTILVDLIYGFVTTFDWTQLGTAVSDFVNGWFEEVDFGKILVTLQELVTGIFESIMTIVSGIQWDEIGFKIADAFSAIGWDGISDSLSKLWEAVLPFAQNVGEGLVWFYENVLVPVGTWVVNDAVPAFLNMLSEAIGFVNQVIETLKPFGEWFFENFLKPIGEWTGGVIVDVLKGIGEGLATASEWMTNNRETVETIATAIASFATSWVMVHAAMSLVNSIAGIVGGAIALLSNPVGLAVLAIGGLILAGVLLYKNWDEIKAWAKEKWDKISETLQGKWEDLKENSRKIWNDVKTHVSEKWEEIKTNASEKWETIKTNLSTKWNTIKSNASTTWENLKTTVSSAWENMRSTASDKWNTITTNLSTKWDEIKTNASATWENVKSNIGTAWENIKTNTSEVWESTKTTITEAWDTLKENARTKFDEVRENIGTKWDEIKKNTSETWDNVKTSLSDSWDTIKANASSGFETMKSTISGIWDNLWSHIGGVIESIKGGIGTMVNWISEKVQSALGWIRNLFNPSGDTKMEMNVGYSYAPDPTAPWNQVGLNRDGTAILQYASGGFPPSGDLFYADENGIPEMIGRIGNRTAVANNDQIVEGVRQGVLSAMQQSGGGGNFDVNVYLDGKQITAVVEKRQRERGAMIYPGGVLSAI